MTDYSTDLSSVKRISHSDMDAPETSRAAHSRIPLRDISPDQVSGLTREEVPAGWSRQTKHKKTPSPLANTNRSPRLKSYKGPLTSIQKLWRYFLTFKNLVFRPKIVKTPPIHLQLESTDACNLHCTSCSRDQFIKKPNILSEQLWKKVIDEIRPTNINVSGIGEPFLHPNLFEIIAYAKKNDAAINCATNFTRIRKNHRTIVESGISQLKISIDAANAETYRIIRGEDAFDEILENIREINRWKEELGIDNPSLRFNFAVQALNFKQAPELVRLAKEVGVSGIYFQYLEYVDMEDRKAMLTAEMTREDLYRTLKEADQTAQQEGIITNLNIWWRDFDIFWNKMRPISKFEPNTRPCLFPTFSTWLGADGWIRPCPIMPWTLDEGRMGNLAEDSFEEIWNNDKYQELRAALKRGERPTRSCKTCVPQSLYNILYLKTNLLPKS